MVPEEEASGGIKSEDVLSAGGEKGPASVEFDDYSYYFIVMRKDRGLW